MDIDRIQLIGLILLIILECKSVPVQDISMDMYWEELTPENQRKIIHNINHGIVLDFYKEHQLSGESLHDDGNAEILLDSLEKYNNSNKILYFYLFNRICLRADGAVAELLGEYCINIFMKDPVYTYRYLEKNIALFKSYAAFMGSEFYFKEDGSSDIAYNFTDFKKIIMKSYLGNEEYVKGVSKFFDEIEQVMKNMD